MGDAFESVVDVDAAEADAPGLAAKTVDWLANLGVIEPSPSGCVLGPSGYRPGHSHSIAVQNTDEELMGLRVNAWR